MDLSKSKVQERYTLSKTISSKGWSWDTQLQASEIIRDCVTSDDRMVQIRVREETAEKVRLLLEPVDSEEQARRILTQFRADLGLPPTENSNA